MYRFLFLSITSALFLAPVSATNVKRCTKGQPFPISVDVEGCDVMPCIVLKGSRAVMKAHFLGTRDDIKKISARVYASTLGITVPYELPAEVADVCSNLLHGATCPIYNTEDVVYDFKFDIDSSYPEVGVKVQVNLMDEEVDKSIACFAVDIKVRKSLTVAQLLNATGNALP